VNDSAASGTTELDVVVADVSVVAGADVVVDELATTPDEGTGMGSAEVVVRSRKDVVGADVVDVGGTVVEGAVDEVGDGGTGPVGAGADPPRIALTSSNKPAVTYA
jgi:hypothetical protein